MIVRIDNPYYMIEETVVDEYDDIVLSLGIKISTMKRHMRSLGSEWGVQLVMTYDEFCALRAHPSYARHASTITDPRESETFAGYPIIIENTL